MKIFISWSGELSRQVAELFGDWIGNVIQGVTPWISTKDIEKGSIWFNEINSQLKDTTFGVLCLTRDNATAPWILFEAGALFKGLTSARVCPLLIDLEQPELDRPLGEINGTSPKKDDMLKLVTNINANLKENRLQDDRLLKAFDHWWPEFEEKFTAILEKHKSANPPVKKTVEQMAQEILETVRSIQSTVNASLGPEKAYFIPSSSIRPPPGYTGPTGPSGPSAYPGYSGYSARAGISDLIKPLSAEDILSVPPPNP